jgi:hypothetical protein
MQKYRRYFFVLFAFPALQLNFINFRRMHHEVMRLGLVYSLYGYFVVIPHPKIPINED